MFCFAGLLGMGIESKRIRKWLSSSAFASLSHRSDIAQEALSEPQSYMGSFNPFPALVIGVTGAAMAAHAQTYLFQVSYHEGFQMSESLITIFFRNNRSRSMHYGEIYSWPSLFSDA